MEAEDPVDAIQAAKSLIDPDMHEVAMEWVDWVGEPDPDYDVEIEDDLAIMPPRTPRYLPEEDTPDENF